MRKAVSTEGGQHSFYHPSDGFTLIETLAAMAILLVLGIGIWQALSGSYRLLGRAKSLALTSTRVLILERALRDELGKIRIPYWVGHPPFKLESNSIALPYLNGQAGDILRVEFEDGYVRIITEEQGDEGITETLRGSFGPFERITWELVTGEEDESRDILFEVNFGVPSGRESEPLQIYITLGSQPLYIDGTAR